MLICCVSIFWMPCLQLAYARCKRVRQGQICGQRRADEPDLWTTSLPETHIDVAPVAIHPLQRIHRERNGC